MSYLWKFHVLLAYNLQPLAKEIRSSIKDTNDSVNKINNFKLPENSFLVTMDVKALCTNISSNKSIAAAKEKCDNYTKKSVATKVITTFLALTLTLNNFIFNSKFYLHNQGLCHENNVALHTQTYSCPSSKREIYRSSH